MDDGYSDDEFAEMPDAGTAVTWAPPEREHSGAAKPVNGASGAATPFAANPADSGHPSNARFPTAHEDGEGRASGTAGVDIAALVEGIQEGVQRSLPSVVAELAASGVASAARFAPSAHVFKPEHPGSAAASRAYASTGAGGGRRAGSSKRGSRKRSKASRGQDRPDAVPATLPARLTRQVASLRALVRSQESRIADLTTQLAAERRARATGEADGEDAPPSAGDGSSRVLREELGRAHEDLARLGQAFAASQRSLERARGRAAREADRADRADAAAKAAEAAAAAFESGCAEAEETVARLVAPRPAEGDEVEVQTPGSLTASPGAVTWRRGRVVAVRRHGAGPAVLTVRLANGRVEQSVDERRVLLRVPPADAAAARRQAASVVEARRSEAPGDGSGAATSDERATDDGGADPALDDEPAGEGEPRELARAGVLVSDAAEPEEAVSEVELRWVAAVLERRCKTLAADNIRLQSQLALLMRELGLTSTAGDGADA